RPGAGRPHRRAPPRRHHRPARDPPLPRAPGPGHRGRWRAPAPAPDPAVRRRPADRDGRPLHARGHPPALLQRHGPPQRGAGHPPLPDRLRPPHGLRGGDGGRRPPG
ncbi:hypothetical protein LTR94_035902, partial [Friedmanniomyces endolithicus]